MALLEEKEKIGRRRNPQHIQNQKQNSTVRNNFSCKAQPKTAIEKDDDDYG